MRFNESLVMILAIIFNIVLSPIINNPRPLGPKLNPQKISRYKPCRMEAAAG